jgi:hypothetical protein
MVTERKYKLWWTMVDGPGEGPAGDGTRIVRFRAARAAESFARGRTCYGRPATVTEDEAPKRLMQRWGLV